MTVFPLHCQKLVSCLQRMGDPNKTIKEVTPGFWDHSTSPHPTVLSPFSHSSSCQMHQFLNLPQGALVGRRQFFAVSAASADPEIVLICLLNKKQWAVFILQAMTGSCYFSLVKKSSCTNVEKIFEKKLYRLI